MPKICSVEGCGALVGKHGANKRITPIQRHKTKGYCYCPNGDFWMAYCCYNGKQYQKRCKTKSEAIEVAASLKKQFDKD